MRFTSIAVAVVAIVMPVTLCAAAPTGKATRWQPILVEQGKRIEVDRSSIAKDSAGKTLALGRIVLDKPINDPKTGASYRIIEAQSRYDCSARTYGTLKRTYFREEGELLREEEVKTVLDMPVRSGTLDDRVLREVCRPSSPQEVQKEAMRTAAKAGEVADDLRRANEALLQKELRRSKPVAEKPAAEKPSREKDPVDKAPIEKAALKPLGDKPMPERDLGDKGRAEKMPLDKAAAGRASGEKTAEEKIAAAKELAAKEPAAKESPAAKAPPVAEEPAETPPARPRRVARPAPRPVAAHSGHAEWSYAGETGPERWGQLRSEWSQCANGRRQSPIDIRDGIRVDLDPIVFDYHPAAFSVIDNGHTVQTTLAGGQLSLLGKVYQLKQFHFHRPAEERVNGRAAEMSLHLVHQAADGRLAVVAIALERGAENPLIQTVWNHLPLEKNEEVSPPGYLLDVNGLLPADRAYFTYMGSLTTPPCSEDVLWLVLKQPLAVSADQIAIFARLYPDNARPVQPTSARLIKESR
ncbi:carbonic anhydrase [Rhodocyclus gracilis]|nr:carbonic anhydrase family protein [Rhodocyclus gracilis]